MPERPRIAILGSGANGSAIAADLVVAGHDVTVVEQWPAHVRAIREHGLRIVMPDDVLEVEVEALDLCDVARLRRRFDVVLVLVKAYDTRWACELLVPHVHEDGLVAGVQNGMTTDVVADVLGARRTVGCVIEISSMLEVPGTVQRHSPPSRSWFAVGPAGAAEGREEEVAALLRCAGAVDVVADVRAAKWMKLVSNCSTLATTAALGLPMVAALHTPGMRELMLRCGQEALDVGALLGLPVLPIFGLSPDDVRDEGTLVETLLDVLYAGFVLEHTTTTVLHDWEKGRRSEAADINGLVVAEAARLGVPAPANAAVLEVARRIERGALRPDRGNLGLLLERSAA